MRNKLPSVDVHDYVALSLCIQNLYEGLEKMCVSLAPLHYGADIKGETAVCNGMTMPSSFTNTISTAVAAAADDNLDVLISHYMSNSYNREKYDNSTTTTTGDEARNTTDDKNNNWGGMIAYDTQSSVDASIDLGTSKNLRISDVKKCIPYYLYYLMRKYQFVQGFRSSYV